MTLAQRGVLCEKMAEEMTNLEISFKQELYQIAYLIGRIANIVSTTVFHSKSDDAYQVFCAKKFKRSKDTVDRYIAFYKFLEKYPKMRYVKNVSYSKLSDGKFKKIDEFMGNNPTIKAQFLERF
jgi:hypothetical protein